MKLRLDYIKCDGFSYYSETDALDNLMNRINEDISYYNPVSIVGVQIFKVEDSTYNYEFYAVVTYTTYEK